MKLRFITLIFTFLLCSNYVLSQTVSACELLGLGIAYYEEEKLDSAILCWTLVIENFEDTVDCYGNCFNNIPIVYQELKQNDKAEEWLLKIIASNLNDSEDNDEFMEPYKNYKHNACLRLSRLYREEGKFEKSLEYIKKAIDTHPYQTFSATSFEKRSVYIASSHAKIWMEKGDNKEALFVMLEKVLDVDVFYRKTEWAGFTNVNFYGRMIEELLPLIEEVYGIDNFKVQLTAAIQQLKVQKTTIGKDKKKAKLATFEIEGRKFRIGSSDKKYKDKDFIKRLLNNQLFDRMESE